MASNLAHLKDGSFQGGRQFASFLRPYSLFKKQASKILCAGIRLPEPGHQSDTELVMTAQCCLLNQHRSFEIMPQVEGQIGAEVMSIVADVRDAQRKNGIN